MDDSRDVTTEVKKRNIVVEEEEGGALGSVVMVALWKELNLMYRIRGQL